MNMGGTIISIPSLDKARQELLALAHLDIRKLRLKEAIGHVTDEGLDARLTSRKLLSICYRRIGKCE